MFLVEGLDILVLFVDEDKLLLRGGDRLSMIIVVGGFNFSIDNEYWC